MSVIVPDGPLVALMSPTSVAYCSPTQVQYGFQRYNLLPPAPAPTPSTQFVRDWWDVDEWGRFYPGNCTRGW